jgi:DNA-binding beta-propeller fold protein YncE
MGVVFSNSGKAAYISCTNRRQIRIVNIQNRTISDSIVLPDASGSGPLMMAKSSDGNTLFVACLNAGTLAFIDLLSKDTALSALVRRPTPRLLWPIACFMLPVKETTGIRIEFMWSIRRAKSSSIALTSAAIQTE